jgi:hypothetical protein
MITIEQALHNLFEWASERDFAGHDPHDLLSSPILSGIHNSIARLIALQIGRRSAIDLHSLFRVPAAENPKALALFITGLLRAKSSATPDWKERAHELGERLVSSMHKDGGWGYPFPWQSRTHFLAKNTPNIVTTSFAGTALIELHHTEPSERLLNAIGQSANYVASLKTLNPKPNTLNPVTAFGYAAHDPQIVFNASLLGGEFLLKAGKLLSNPKYVELARQSGEFVASHQQPNGAWAYGLEASQKWIDSFHTGFTIVSMKSIADSLGDEHLAESARKGFEYYKSNFLEPDYAIRYFQNNRYPIDSHALGQAMVTFSEFGDSDTARRIAEWSITNMRSESGYFYYQRHRFFTNRIPYMRWSNAWIFRGISSVVAGFPGPDEVAESSWSGNPPTTNG